MSEQERLPEDLKALEAQLASLVPRTDRLDRERLIFLAGRESAVAEHARPARRAGRWTWPAAFAAMTAVAAALMVMLLVQPDPEVVTRFVEVPAEPARPDTIVPAPQVKPSFLDSEHVQTQPPVAKPAGSSFWAAVGLPWLEDHSENRFGRARPYPRLVQQILAEGLDSWQRPPSAVTPSTQPAVAPVPNRQFLERLLDEHAQVGSAPVWPTSAASLYSGANS